jgi:GTP-binding protein HflX
VVFSDTVGFIKKLPHQLVESFKSTLEEVAVADLLLHVVDCSDPKQDEHIRQTKSVLAEIGADQVPYVMVYNKLDMNHEFTPAANDQIRAFAVSAVTGEGVDELRAELVSRAGMFAEPIRQTS